jgi:DNA-binding FrmR family transcriptional regulator
VPRTKSIPATAAAAGPAVVASCGCGVAAAQLGDDADHGAAAGRKAVAVDADAKERNRKRLRRIEGQVRGLQRMVDEDRYCADIMTQIASVHEALRSVGRELMRNHLKHCASAAIRGSDGEAEAMYDELLDLMYRNVR